MNAVGTFFDSDASTSDSDYDELPSYNEKRIVVQSTTGIPAAGVGSSAHVAAGAKRSLTSSTATQPPHDTGRQGDATPRTAKPESALPPLVLSHAANDDGLEHLLPSSGHGSNSKLGKPNTAEGSTLFAGTSTMRRSARAADPLSEAKKQVLMKNSVASPCRNIAEEVVLQRFGDVPPPPTPNVVTEPIMSKNSREEKHFANKLRLFGTLDTMHKAYAEGTFQRPSDKVIDCRAASSGGGTDNNNGSTPRRTHSPRGGSQVPNHSLGFVNLKHFEPHGLEHGTVAGESPAAQSRNSIGVGYLPPPSPRSQMSTRGGENNFFLCSRAQNQISAGPQPSPSPSRTLPSVQSARPATHPTTEKQTPCGTSQSARKPSSRNNKDAAAALLDDPDDHRVEDTAYVVEETRRFERQTLSRLKKELMSHHAGDMSKSMEELQIVRSQQHTSDLLKMIFNSRIALECEVATELREAATERGPDKLIADAISTATRLGLRSAGVDEFHHFLCNLLRDTDISFSETRVIFNVIDANQSGVIDSGEVSEGLRLLLLDETQLVLTYGNRIFTEVGRHKDTRLSFLEVQAIFFAVLDFFECDFVDTEMFQGESASLAKESFVEQNSMLVGMRHLQSQGLLPRPPDQEPRKSRSNTLNGPSFDHHETQHHHHEKQSTPPSEAFPTPQSPFLKSPKSQKLGSFSSTTGSSKDVPVKPTIESLKKQMVAECKVVLREAWKYSTSGQVVVSLLRSLTQNNGPLLMLACCSVPVTHFSLKRSGFWKDTLAKEEAKHQQFLAAHNLDLELAVKSHRKLSFGGNALKARRKSYLQQQLQPTTAQSPNGGSTPRPGKSISVACGDADLIRELDALQSPSGGAGGRKLSSREHPQGLGGGSRAQLDQRDTSGTLASVQPISYEEYEEANGEAVNINMLAQQLKDGNLRLSQAQRSLIMQQIQQGKQQKQQQSRKSIAGFQQQPSTNNTTRKARETSRSESMVGLSGNNTPKEEPLGTASPSPPMGRRKSERGSTLKGQQQHFIDLNEVVDAWHPKFQADINKNSNLQRQLTGAPEHNQMVYFSRQGHVFSRTPNGIIVPVGGGGDGNGGA